MQSHYKYHMKHFYSVLIQIDLYVLPGPTVNDRLTKYFSIVNILCVCKLMLSLQAFVDTTQNCPLMISGQALMGDVNNKALPTLKHYSSDTFAHHFSLYTCRCYSLLMQALNVYTEGI